MTTTRPIAIGDHPEPDTAYRAGLNMKICGATNDFGGCPVDDCTANHHMTCTAPDGHLLGDVPHIAIAAGYGVAAIWTDFGDALLGNLDELSDTLINAGATL